MAKKKKMTKKAAKKATKKKATKKKQFFFCTEIGTKKTPGDRGFLFSATEIHSMSKCMK